MVRIRCQHKDIQDLIEGYVNGILYDVLNPSDEQELAGAGKYWQHLIESARMELKMHPHWTTQHSLGRMPYVVPDFYTSATGTRNHGRRCCWYSGSSGFV